ncbi:hypothetical protein DPX16_7478 [Anabarilius grahami]|uniref:Uncharacterized protein n=1 Tax=Anabarilius grahami TaxID=495550 RepID=A0A3N0YLG2_ANAGA|nr:hypothetical protein DPX16_7478 [Anabarilius grahami]
MENIWCFSMAARALRTGAYGFINKAQFYAGFTERLKLKDGAVTAIMIPVMSRNRRCSLHRHYFEYTHEEEEDEVVVVVWFIRSKKKPHCVTGYSLLSQMMTSLSCVRPYSLCASKGRGVSRPRGSLWIQLPLITSPAAAHFTHLYKLTSFSSSLSNRCLVSCAVLSLPVPARSSSRVVSSPSSGFFVFTFSVRTLDSLHVSTPCHHHTPPADHLNPCVTRGLPVQ